MILSHRDLLQRLPEIIPHPQHREEKFVQKASIDIRIGTEVIYERKNSGMGYHVDISLRPYPLQPQEFVLACTYEYICVPTDLAIELKLKSSSARAGFDHSLAFWVDPGWRGVLTMEIRNNLRFTSLEIAYKMLFAQLIVHKLTTPVEEGYCGKYQDATSVEAIKAD